MNIIHRQKIYTYSELHGLYHQPFHKLIHLAHGIHREFHDPAEIKIAGAISVKTGRCPEDCSFCPQSAHYDTKYRQVVIRSHEEIIAYAQMIQKLGATQICLGAAWRSIPNNHEFEAFVKTIPELNVIGLRVCFSMGMLTLEQAILLRDAGLYEYNNNLDTAASFYINVIKTRTYEERLESIENIINANLRLSCGGILGLGESVAQRIEFIHTLSKLKKQPDTVPLNALYPSEGTPLADCKTVDPFEYIRTVALARIAMPRSEIALAAGRNFMSSEMQALCFYVGTGTFYIGEKIFTTASNHPLHEDLQMIDALGVSIRK